MFLRTACAILLATTASLSFAQSLAGRNSLIGVVTESSDADKLKTQMTFVDLDKQVVTVVWPSGHQYKMSKTFDSKGIVVLQFVGEMTGSTDTIHLDIANSRFLLVSVVASEVLGTRNPLTVSTSRGALK